MSKYINKSTFNKILFALICTIIINFVLGFYVYINRITKSVMISNKIPRITQTSADDGNPECFNSMCSNNDLTSCWTTSAKSPHTINLIFPKLYKVTGYSLSFQQPYNYEHIFVVISKSSTNKQDLIQYNTLSNPNYTNTTSNGLVTTYYFDIVNKVEQSNIFISFGSINGDDNVYTVCDINCYGNPV